VAFNPDGTRLVTASLDGTTRVWDAQAGTPLATLTGHTDTVFSAAFSPDGTRLVTGGQDRTLRVWDAQQGIYLLALTAHTGPVRAVAFSPDGSRLATGGLINFGNAVIPVAFSPDGSRLATASEDNTVRVWDVHLETRSPAEVAALVRCHVPWRLEAGVLLEATPDPVACAPPAPVQ
jgi:WD40 repeat protein